MSGRVEGAELSEAPERDAPPRAVLIAAIVLAVAVLAGVLVIARIATRPAATEPVGIADVPAPQADSAECRQLIAALPTDIENYRRAPIADPAPAGTAAWRAHDDPVAAIFRCGLNRPADFVQGAAIQQINGVQWFRVADDPLVTYYVVDRPVYAAVTLAQQSGTGVLQELADLVASTLPARPIDPAPAR
ncbi:DUF3515 domain-containing protein [Mycobacterium sp. MYCO198283]|uniref:DUF3515 domain-containing protein n=1 Tax=Mycobacterium sp. MYCO198283 TaxID=2883505 RepID=UPI001E57F27E|nr:DUF3515 domain-containing protein [Mycobacterium sp. MYCO198283]MCG5433703.1 DUF3515 domain-containing protein [Mycobacterium sp. MYCO198283]